MNLIKFLYELSVGVYSWWERFFFWKICWGNENKFYFMQISSLILDPLLRVELRVLMNIQVTWKKFHSSAKHERVSEEKKT